jgi:hypothetical protein
MINKNFDKFIDIFFDETMTPFEKEEFRQNFLNEINIPVEVLNFIIEKDVYFGLSLEIRLKITELLIEYELNKDCDFNISNYITNSLKELNENECLIFISIIINDIQDENKFEKMLYIFDMFGSNIEIKNLEFDLTFYLKILEITKKHKNKYINRTNIINKIHLIYDEILTKEEIDNKLINIS